MSRRFGRLVGAALLPLLLVLDTHPARASVHSREAAALARSAAAHFAQHTIEGRRVAIDELEQATRLAPGEPEYELQLARVYYTAGFVHAALRRYERVVALAPDNAAGHLGLGQTWRRDWLKFVDSTSLARAATECERATQLDSTLTEAWVMLSSLRVAQRDDAAALGAAEHAATGAAGRIEPLLALGSARWRTGDVAGADSAFRAVLPRLPRNVRERFDDIAPLASEQDTMLYNHLPAAGQTEFARRFWQEHDPDLATPENEAQLEYWARVAQAFFLYYDAKHEEWDERGEVYVRYGPPGAVVYDPLGVSLYTSVGDSHMPYPMNVLVWDYPELGMRVLLQDRTLSEYYLLPMTRDYDPDPRPNPDSLARLGGVGTHDLRGVFAARPPRSRPLAVQGLVARFVSARGGRIFAALGAPASPGDSLVAQAVVLDSTQHEVLRLSRALSPSACEADRFRVADFGAELPPGDYLAGLSAHAGDRRGSTRVRFTVPRPDSALALSDVVVTCGTPAFATNTVRLDPNPAARVTDGALLSAYFEISNLSAGAGGRARFELIYTVRSAAADGRIWIQRMLSPRGTGPSIEASRIEEFPAGLRRQFVSVPVQSLPPGEYRLEIHVRDLVSGDEVARSARFTRVTGG